MVGVPACCMTALSLFAIGTIFRKNCLVDVVRIYDANMSGEKLKHLKKKYIEAIKK